LVWRFDVAAMHGVVVNVLDLLAQHRVGLDALRMDALLPDLAFAAVFV